MLKEVKKIIIQELEEYKRKINELEFSYKQKETETKIEKENLEKKRQELFNKLNDLYHEAAKLSNKINLFNKMKIKKEILKLQGETSSIQNRINEFDNQLNLAYDDTKRKVLDVNDYVRKLEITKKNANWNDVNELIELVNQCQSLKQLGLKFYDAVELLRKNEIPIILDESDKNYEESGFSGLGIASTEYSKNVKDTVDLSPMKDYILVHKTRFYPQNGRINTSKDAKPVEKVSLELKKIGLIDYENHRNTIHFAVNGEVGSHALGNWEDCKYAILIPFTDMPPGQFRSGASMDTYIEGGLSLPKSTIVLCPQEERQMIQEFNPNQMVVGYIGENVFHYADSMVEQLGYKVQEIHDWRWNSYKDEVEYYKKLSETGLDIHVNPHTGTIEKQREDKVPKVYAFIEVIKKIINNNIFLDESDIEILLDDTNISFVPCDYTELNIEILQILENGLKPFGLTIKEELKNKFLNSEYESRKILCQDLLMQSQKLINNDLEDENVEEVNHSK